MEKELSSVFNWTIEKSKSYIGKRAPFEVLRGLFRDPPEDLSPLIALRSRKWVMCSLILACECMARYREIIEGLSSFELSTILTVNPFYLTFSSRVAILDCFELVRTIGLETSNETAAHALLMDALRGKPSITLAAADAIIAEFSLRAADAPRFEAEAFLPFPRSHLAEHIFRDLDPEIMPAAELGNIARDAPPAAKGGASLMQLIRERRFMTNRIRRIEDGYTLRDEAAGMIDEIQQLRERAAVFSRIFAEALDAADAQALKS